MAAATAAAAAAATAFSSSKGLFLLLTLLSLVCFSNSLLDKDKVAIDEWALFIISKSMADSISSVERFMASPINLIPMDIDLNRIKGLMQRTKNIFDRKFEDLDTKIEDGEEEVRTIDKLIKFLEENKAVL
ncbi:hypothetical protein INR49_011686 [Caranx melampygus]|nr:hypothetical protein INR49_011686 [Caranx melampygus]